MNYYEHHLGDYLRDTAHLSVEEDCAYRRLIDRYYMDESPLPANVADAARLVRMRDHTAVVEAVLAEFFDLQDDGWHHKRCDEEIARYHQKVNKAKASAAASVNARRANAERTLNERSTDVQLSRLQTPDSSLQSPKKESEGSRKHSPRQTATRLGDDFDLTPERRKVAEAERLDPARTFAKFRDYWLAASGAKARKHDWDATWRNWCRTEADRAKGNPRNAPAPVRPPPTAEEISATRDAAARANREEIARKMGGAIKAVP